MTTDERKTLNDEICRYLMPIVPDIQDVQTTLYMILNNYEITSRCTEIAELSVDRNEYLLKKFLLAKTVQGCSKRTIDFYKKSCVKILQQIGKTVDNITVDDIRYYMALRQKRDGVSKTTIGNEIRVLSSFFTWLHKEEIIKSNPMNKLERLRKVKTKKEALTEIEIEKLRVAVRNEREKLIVELLLSTGCRVSEVVNILLSEIEDDRILVHGKGAKDRYVYLNARAMLSLELYLNARNDTNPYLLPRRKLVAKEKKRAGRSLKTYHNWWKEAENVDVGHAEASTIEVICRGLAKRAGVERANPHKFRRTCATLALRRGMPIEQVSKMLGHESVSTTQIYLDLSEDDLVQAHKKYVV